MGMNTGMLFGKIESPWGPTKDVMVDISKLTGDENKVINIQANEDNPNAPTFVTTGSDGKYILPFFWHGTEIAKAAPGLLRVSCFAHKLDTDRSVRRGHLCMNLKALFSNIYPTFEQPTQEALDVAKDFLLAFRQIKAFPPSHKILLSTEIWGIMAQANFFIRANKN